VRVERGDKHVGAWRVAVLDAAGQELAAKEVRVVAPTDPAVAQQACRALVNVRMAGAGGAPPSYRVVDLRLAERSKALSRSGLVVRAGEQTWALQVVRYHEREEAQAEGRTLEVTREWDELDAIDLATRKRATWLSPKPELGLPEADAVGGNEGQHFLSVTTVSGDLIGLSVAIGGFAGGAHGYDDSYMTTVRAGSGAKVSPAALVGDAAVAAFQRAIAAEASKHEADWAAPQVKGLDDLKAVALTWGAEGDAGDAGKGGNGGAGHNGGPRLTALLGCCTWAENHGMIEISVPLPDGAAAALGLGARAGGLHVAPDECGAVGLEGGKLVARLGADGARQAIGVSGGAVGQILGVTWLPAGDSFDPRKVPATRAEVAELLERGRELVQQGQHAEGLKRLKRALHRLPGDAAIAAEIGWAHLQAGELDKADKTTRQALRWAREAGQRGMCLYNLGRIAQQRGDKDLAAAFYEGSLKLRPNASVQARLDALKAQ
jgi:tetratricopeptide (TPR) repeat protein